jgi:hypothetical protein
MERGRNLAMFFATKDDITEDVMKLMNPEDEAEWLREGLFKESDLLGSKQWSPPIFYSSKSLSFTLYSNP